MNKLILNCTFCNKEVEKLKKDYNRSIKKNPNYNPFCNNVCRAAYVSAQSIVNEGLSDSEKKCTKCLKIKSRKDDFSLNTTWCKLCSSEYQKEYRKVNSPSDRSKYQKEYRELNIDKILETSRNYYAKNKDGLKEVRAIYYKNNKDKIRAQGDLYYQNNKEQILAYQAEYQKENKEKVRAAKKLSEQKRIEKDPAFKLRKRVSSQIRGRFKKFGLSKNKQSFIKYLEYSIEELRSHLESQFESWMTWDNYGSYKKDSWKDDNQSTWTWNIDHIIPQSTLPYTSMEDDNFKLCWALNNLRPYSSKQNLIDSVR